MPRPLKVNLVLSSRLRERALLIPNANLILELSGFCNMIDLMPFNRCSFVYLSIVVEKQIFLESS